jgi:uncharacterized protein YdeI (YjbR/CyaY-like superfamily)
MSGFLLVNVKFFKSQSDFRKWLEKNHNSAKELWVGYYKKSTGKKSITHPEAVDEALCFGWIDGIRKSIDENSYTNRFSPRKAKSNWSKVNITRFNELRELGLVSSHGMKTFEERDQQRSGYSIQDRTETLDPKYERKFKANKKAWDFFQSLPPGFRRNAIFYVTSAKQEQTRERRLARIIEDCNNGVRVGVLNPSAKQK